MTTETPHIEDVAFQVGYRVRAALELIYMVTADECDGPADANDVLCSAEALLAEANKIILGAVPHETPQQGAA